MIHPNTPLDKFYYFEPEAEDGIGDEVTAEDWAEFWASYAIEEAREGK